MRYAIISDIHSNSQALKAVLKDIRNNGIDEIICLGDLVGYGPSPLEVMDILRENVNYFVLGNHDAVTAGYITGDNFNLSARKTIDWTQKQLDEDAVEFLQSLPLQLMGDNISFVHGEFENPGRFGYVDDDNSALGAFKCSQEALLMLGHSHIPGIFVIGNSGIPHWLAPQDFNMEEEKRYIVNVGSVGQPRDYDNRASYCIVDNEQDDILFRKIPFDIEGYIKGLRKNALPEVSTFLQLTAKDVETRSIPTADIVKKTSDFTPLSKKATVKLKTEVLNLKQAVRDLHRSRKTLRIIIIILIAILIAAVTSFFFVPRKTNVVTGTHRFNSFSSDLPHGLHGNIDACGELIMMPDAEKIASKNNPFQYWTISLSDLKQSVEIQKEKDITVFNIKSNTVNPVELQYIPIPVEKGMRFTGSAQFKAVDLKSGFVEIMLKQKFPDGTEKTLVKREPKNLAKSGKWTSTSVTISTKSPISEDGKLYFAIKGQFVGEILIRKCSLKRKK